MNSHMSKVMSITYTVTVRTKGPALDREKATKVTTFTSTFTTTLHFVYFTFCLF